MDKKKVVQQIANKAGVSFSKAVAILRKMNNMQEVKSKLKENNNDKKR